MKGMKTFSSFLYPLKQSNNEELSVPWRPDRISILPFGYDAFLRHFSLESFPFPSWFFILFFSVLFLCEYIWGHWWVFVVGAGLCLQHMGSRMCGLSTFDVRDHSSPVRHWPRACCFGSLLLWELAALGACCSGSLESSWITREVPIGPAGFSVFPWVMLVYISLKNHVFHVCV